MSYHLSLTRATRARRRTRGLFFQPKLTVNAPGDHYEQEADRVAGQVAGMPPGQTPAVAPVAVTPVSGGVQRAPEEPEKEEKESVQRKESGAPAAGTRAATPIVHQVVNSGGGQALDAGTRRFMESRFGQDFGQVRIHTSGRAAESAESIQARAYTSGQHIVFGPGEYQPESERGRYLLAHELTHTLQQRAGAPTLVQAKTKREEFQEKKYELKNYHPPTGRGLFDVKYNPYNGELEARVKIKFNFVDGSAAEFPTAKAKDLAWTDTEKKNWRKQFITLVEGRWGGKYLFMNTDPDLKGIYAYVDVEVDAVEKDFHYEATITKIPKGQFKTSSVTPPGATATSSTAAFDSEDFRFVKKSSGIKQKQQAATHEFGHILGLGDEYGAGAVAHAGLVKSALGTDIVKGDSDNIMAGGDTIAKQHYVTFWDALKKVTGIETWKFK